MKKSDPESGVVLVNVLVILAIAGGVMFLLLSTQEAALDRVARAADAAVVEQIALGAEASVVDALRQDMDDAPENDHLGEPWALGVIQKEIELPTGKFSVQIRDLQAKFNINLLGDKTIGTRAFGQRLMIALDQPPETANQIAGILGILGEIEDLNELAVYGISDAVLTALEPYVVALPLGGSINLNTADPVLLAVMTQNPSLTAQLIQRRARKGFLTTDDLNDIGVLRPQNSGFTSNAYLVEILAQAGDAEMTLQTILMRRDVLGRKSVEILQRRIVHDTPTPDGD